MDRTVTPTTVKTNLSSLRSSLGKAAEIARAAEAPQIATDPEDKKANLSLCLNKGAIAIPKKIVNKTPVTTMNKVFIPKSLSISKLTLSPSRAMPSLSIVRAENSIPA